MSISITASARGFEKYWPEAQARGSLGNSSMLLRWLVNQYLRDAAHGKAREIVTDLVQSPRTGTRQPAAAPIERTSSPTESPEFLPCDAVFIFALGIESGGLVDSLQGAETSRHAHGIERAGKLGRHE